MGVGIELSYGSGWSEKRISTRRHASSSAQDEERTEEEATPTHNTEWIGPVAARSSTSSGPPPRCCSCFTERASEAAAALLCQPSIRSPGRVAEQASIARPPIGTRARRPTWPRDGLLAAGRPAALKNRSVCHGPNVEAPTGRRDTLGEEETADAYRHAYRLCDVVLSSPVPLLVGPRLSSSFRPFLEDRPQAHTTSRRPSGRTRSHACLVARTIRAPSLASRARVSRCAIRRGRLDSVHRLAEARSSSEEPTAALAREERDPLAPPVAILAADFESSPRVVPWCR